VIGRKALLQLRMLRFGFVLGMSGSASTLACLPLSANACHSGNAYVFRGTNDSKGGIEKDLVKECSGGWVPS
jgi:hypothetical protein